MNKKIKIIELIDKIYHKNNIPKRIKYKYKIWLYDNVEERYCLESSFVTLSFETDRLTDEVEILEDNTEEIEELKPFDEIRDVSVWDNRILSTNQRAIAVKINEIIRYIKRKEKE